MTVDGVQPEHIIGLVGVGNLGQAIAKSLLREDFSVAAFDLDEQALANVARLGATPTGSLGELIDVSDVISLLVVNDEQVRTVCAEVFQRATRGTIAIIHSTVAPATVVELAEVGAPRGIAVIDVPVNGGWEKAELGTLMLMIGGEHAAVQQCRPILEALGESLFHLGPPGAGAAAKLVNNLIITGSYAVMVEAMQLAAAYGLDEDTVATFVTAGEGDSRQMRVWGRHDRTRRERAAVGIDWSERMGRDLLEAALAGGQRELTMPLAGASGQMMPFKLRQRDKELLANPPVDIPRCSICHWELAAPFRADGVHPECVRSN